MQPNNAIVWRVQHIGTVACPSHRRASGAQNLITPQRHNTVAFAPMTSLEIKVHRPRNAVSRRQTDPREFPGIMEATVFPICPTAVTMPKPVIQETLNALGATVFERGWLSSNNVLVQGDGHTALVDSGYSAHAPLTLALVQEALKDRPLDLLLNTHLHSDHCGGNALLQASYPALQTRIPPGHADAVSAWDAEVLTYEATGQTCPRFTHQGLLNPGDTLQLGAHPWEVHGAKGHDPHSVILFQRDTGVLISADALWNNGFGVVFPELEGIDAFDEVGETLDVIEALQPRTVIPGHGPVFTDVEEALARARSRLAQFLASPERHRRYALKVLVKFKLLEWQAISQADLLAWSRTTPYMRSFMPDNSSPVGEQAWLADLLTELERSGSLRIEGKQVVNL